MQLMPSIAGYIAGDRRFRRSRRHELFDPATNLSLGQKYLRYLLADQAVNGDLLRMAVAWNGGPGNLARWSQRSDHLGDPLFFIEAIPSRETRQFVERVLANLWIYRDRLGQPTPSLDALAAGDRPIYTTLDGQRIEVAAHGSN